MEGHVDKEGAMTGREITYVYPDGSTVLVGSFKDGVMVRAWPGRLLGSTRHGSSRCTLNKNG